MHLAVFTSLNPVQSALSDHMEGLLPYLAKHFEITVVTRGTYQPTHPMFRPGGELSIPWITYAEFQRRVSEFDLIVYQLGDDGEAHEHSFDALHRYPGLVLLHDLVLQNARVELTIRRGKPEAYIAEMRYSYGEEGERLARQIIAKGGEEYYMRYPLMERVLNDSLAVVGFNQHMCDKMRLIYPDLLVRRILYHFYLPSDFPSDFDGAAFRRQLGLEDCSVLASFGFFFPGKRLELALRTFKRLVERHPTAVYLLVGGHNEYYDLRGHIQSLGLGDKIRLTGWQSPVPFVKYMFAVDLALHLRYPHVFGTPYTPMRLLGLGIPTVVSDIEPLAEIPSNAVVRITPERADEEEMVFAAMDYLLTHRDLARAMGDNARRYIAQYHNVALIAEQFVDLIHEVAARRAELEADVRRRKAAAAAALERPCSASHSHIIGSALVDMGLTHASDHLLTPIAEALHSLAAPQRK